MSRAKLYDCVRFTWWRNHDPVKLVETLKREFTVTPPRLETKSDLDLYDWSLYKGHRWEILVKADTLSAFLCFDRAVLFQAVRVPFTKRDMELRRTVFCLYPRNRPTPFPFGFSLEPPFEIERG